MTGLEVTVRIDAPAGRVWELIGDPSHMGRWSPECRQVEWAHGSSGPALRARFKGHNQLGWRRWTTTGTIVAYDPGSEVAWDVTIAGLPIATWAYRVDARGDGHGCTLTERFTDRRNKVFRSLGPMARGVRDAEAHNRAGMEQTLARIKAVAESAPSPPSSNESATP